VIIIIKSEARRILDIVAELSQNNVKKDILETEIISRSGLPAEQARNYLHELEWLHLVKESSLPTPTHAEFRLWNITEKGLQDRSHLDYT
jgi:predicted transcriptional regulator